MKSRDLLLHGRHHPRRGIADRRDRDTRAEVDQLVAVDVDHDAATGPFDVDRQRGADARCDCGQLARLQLLGPRAGDGRLHDALLRERSCLHSSIGDTHVGTRVVTQNRLDAASSASRCAIQTGTIAITIRTAATTLITGAWLGRNRLREDPQRQRLRCARSTVNVVTTISSKLSANASSAPATQRAADQRERHVPEGLPAPVAPRSADASSSAPSEPPQPGLHVVEDDDDAERRMADDHRHQPEVDRADRRWTAPR